MKTYIPMRHTCMVSRRAGNDAFGKPKVNPPHPVRCQVIRAVTARSDTPLGLSSGSKGHAEETLADFEMMVRDADVKLHDVVQFGATLYVVASVEPQFSAFGDIDHHIVRGEIEQKTSS